MDATIAALLADIAAAPRIALVVDVDAIDAASEPFRPGVMTRALDAITHAGVHVVLWSRHAAERAARLHRGIPRSWWLEAADPAAALRQIQDRFPGARVVAITDDAALRAALDGSDRAFPVASRERSIPAACWWLTQARIRAGLTGPPRP